MNIFLTFQNQDSRDTRIIWAYFPSQLGFVVSMGLISQRDSGIPFLGSGGVQLTSLSEHTDSLYDPLLSLVDHTKASF